MKYLLLILFILLVIFATKALRGKQGPTQGQSGKSRPRSSGGDEGSDEKVMLSCAHCGLHLPANEALPGRGGVFCSEEHRTRFEARNEKGG